MTDPQQGNATSYSCPICRNEYATREAALDCAQADLDQLRASATLSTETGDAMEDRHG
jgi:hypothetical protein